jgi:hypothetical protein
MKRQQAGFLIIAVLTLSACAPVPAAPPAASPPVSTPAPPVSPTDSLSRPTPTELLSTDKNYLNETFGLGFRFPLDWFGPEEYVSGQTLRVEIGSDRVYPYGTDPAERTYEMINSYSIVIQLTRGGASSNSNETYQVLAGMQEGGEVSNARSTTKKIRDIELGRFKGFEFITTLSMTASTQPFYSREVILIDDQSNLLTIFGSPNNVVIPPGEGWREIFESIDKENRAAFDEILETISVE